MSHIQIDINALISSDTTKISEIRAAIKLLHKQTLKKKLPAFKRKKRQR
jgi:hypothetical protein